MKKRILILPATLLISTLLAWKTHINTSDPKAYFGNYLNQKSFTDMAYRSLATLEECRQVFTDSAARIYSQEMVKMKAAYDTSSTKDATSETFVDVNYEKFTTEDVQAGKGNYAGGMNRIKSFLKPGITFYKIEFLREKGASQGMAYNCWVLLAGQWVFFPKPWKVLQSKS
ncbi:MAG: hypothetical protein ACHQF2_10365 [Flavobacteriales bacterium]